MVEYYYDAWGNHKVVDADGDEITDQDNIGNLNPFRYRGYYYDTETGLYFLQTRYYDPEVGRFLNRDSVQYADPETINGLNLYAYCLNNPVEYVDPNGNFILSAFLICVGVGVIVGGTLGGFTAAQSGSNIFLGIFTGALLGGAVGAIAGLGGAYLMGGVSSIAFIFGGFLGGANLGLKTKGLLDVAARPFVNQLIKTGTRGAELEPEKLIYDIIARALTHGFNGGRISLSGEKGFLLNPGTPGLTINLSKALARALFSSFAKLFF